MARSSAIGIAALLTSIVLSAVGQLGMKVGMQQLHLAAEVGLAVRPETWAAFGPAALWTALGLAAYSLSLAAWLAVLVRYPLSFAYPLLSLSYVLVYLGATLWPVLGEHATPLRSIGTLFVIGGVMLISLKRPESGAY